MPLGTAGYASFARRFAAMFLDGILMILAIFPSAFIIGLVIGVAGVLVQMPYQGRLLVAKLSGFVFAVLVRWFYFAACECSVWQATPGKKALGIRVTDLQGNRISFGRATKRFFSKYISSLALGFGFWCVLWDQRSQGWHDRIADTLVLNR